MIALKRVDSWQSAAEFAENTDYTTRQLRNLESVGLPVRGHGTARAYPIPDAFVWMMVYRQRVQETGRAPEWLDLDEAMAVYAADNFAELVAAGHRPRPQYDDRGCRLIDERDYIEGYHVLEDPPARRRRSATGGKPARRLRTHDGRAPVTARAGGHLR